MTNDRVNSIECLFHKDEMVENKDGEDMSKSPIVNPLFPCYNVLY